MRTPLGRYTKIRRNNPRALAVCDYSGFFCRHEDLVKQMVYEGNGLVWNGFWVNKVFADKPNPQMLTPIMMADPFPIYPVRPDTAVDVTPPGLGPVPITMNSDGVYVPQNPAPPSEQPYPSEGIYIESDFY